MEPRLKEAEAGKRTVYFVDAAHFVLQAFLGFLWCFQRIFIKAPCGRQRLNVLGALNAISHEVITVVNETYINAQSVCELLVKIAQQRDSHPITLVMDNARYQRCNLVMDKAKELNIELLFLPSYSPNLNLIERLWKYVKKTCLYSRYYTNFSDFKLAITKCLDELSEHKKELETLLTLRFQTFSKSQIEKI